MIIRISGLAGKVGEPGVGSTPFKTEKMHRQKERFSTPARTWEKYYKIQLKLVIFYRKFQNFSTVGRLRPRTPPPFLLVFLTFYLNRFLNELSYFYLEFLKFIVKFAQKRKFLAELIF